MPKSVFSFWVFCSKDRIKKLCLYKNGVVLKYIYSENDEHEEQPHNNEEENKAEGEGEDQSIFETNWDESVEKFDDLNLKEEVLRGIYGYGFERPSPIQQKAVLPILQGRDTIAQVSILLNLIRFVNR